MTICMHTPIERQRHVPCALCQVEEFQHEVRRLQQLIRVADDVGNKAATEIEQLRSTLSLAEEGLANYAQDHQQYVEWASPQLERLGREMLEVERLKRLLNPRLWTREEDNAWCRAIPDLYKAFEALRGDVPQPDKHDLTP